MEEGADIKREWNINGRFDELNRRVAEVREKNNKIEREKRFNEDFIEK